MDDYDKKEIVFFGKITAGITHEIKNVLAIISESAGLIEDLCALTPEAVPHSERIKKALVTINGQIERGADLSTGLNRFAHSPDSAVKTVDLSEVTGQMIILSQRFARLKNVTLTSRPPTQSELPVRIIINPVRLQMALFAAIECWLARTAPGDQINIYPVKTESGGAIMFVRESPPSEKSDSAPELDRTEKWSLLLDRLTLSGGRAEIKVSPPGLLIFFPN